MSVIPHAITAKDWKAISRNEREIQINGRNFFACRCNPSAKWKILEFGPDGKLIDTIYSGVATKELSECLMESLKESC
jgi:hypothetical protein